MIRPLLWLYFVCILMPFAMAQRPSVTKLIEKKTSWDQSGSVLNISGVELYGQLEIPTFYSNRKFKRAWRDIHNVNDLVQCIEMSVDEGLDPRDYHYDRIMYLMGKKLSLGLNNEEKADLDILLTDAMILYMAHLMGGKLEQSELRSAWDVEKNARPSNVDSLLTVTLHNNMVKEVLEQSKPTHYLYEHMKSHLKRLRSEALKGAWPHVSAGKALKPGISDSRVLEVRAYLLRTGDLVKADDTGGEFFDQNLRYAVQRFQRRHGLEENGNVGLETLEQMQVSIDDRIETLRVNLERLRWIFHYPDRDFLVVNIAGFELKRFTDREEVFRSRVIVGEFHRKTPVFKGLMKYVVVNPTWILPYSISTGETLPMLQKDPNYLFEQHMEVSDSSGVHIDPSTLDWSKYSSSHFPFIIRQKPGPWNALGEVKFMFPNKYRVYLHDTPSRGLFDRSQRAFSHGCIRTEDVWPLFISLMDDPENWNQEKIDEMLESGETVTIHLPKPVPIYIIYLTATVDEDDRLYFLKDVYKRDPAISELLNVPRDP